ncbi:hypothetical protein FACS1894141_7450 [Spirochaetia bacterium]|nr:hypothetical protein FACS1894141_7450 [Spirochaetia bacterium]
MSDRFTELVNRADDRFIQENIYRVSKTLLAKALKTADPASRQKILRNMGESGAAEMENRIAGLGSIPPEEAEAAQQEIISMAAPYI